MQSDESKEMDLSPEEMVRFASHIALPEFGVNGQKNLKNAAILCIGSGGLGSPLLLYLAAAGIGRIGIVDFDVVETSNLQRQVIHGTSFVGQLKTTSASARINEINPHCQVDIYEKKLTYKNAIDIIKKYDLVCDCTDNFPTRYLINDACILLGKPNIYGSIQKFEGQVSVFNLHTNSPNYRDLVPEAPPSELVPSCSEGGVLGVVPGLIGIIQATEAIKIITGTGAVLSGRLLVFNALTMTFKELKIMHDDEQKIIDNPSIYNKFYNSGKDSPEEEEEVSITSISVQELKSILEKSSKITALIDVRNPSETSISKIENSELIPLCTLENQHSIQHLKNLARLRKLYVICKSGKRSAKAIKILKAHKIDAINVAGGIDEYSINFPESLITSYSKNTSD